MNNLKSTKVLKKVIIQDVSVISANLMSIFSIQPDELLIKTTVPKAELWEVPHLRVLLSLHLSFIL